MGTLLIDKLLQTVVAQGGSDLHISVGQPPVIRLDGHMRKLETKILEPDDTTALMKSITPERCQQELQEVGGTDFGFAFGEAARFRVAIFKQRGSVGMVLRRIPNDFLTFDQLGVPAVITDLIMRPRGLFLVTGPTGSGKSTTLASMINYINDTIDHHIITIEDPIEFYHHSQEVNAQSTRDRRRRAELPRGDSPRSANGSRCDSGGRNARPGNDRSGDHRRRDGPRRLRDAAHHGCRGYGQPHHRRVSPRINKNRFACNSRRPSSVSCRRRCCPKSAGPRRCLRDAGRHARDRQPDSRNKTFRITSAIQTGAKYGMQLLDDALFNLWRSGTIDKEDAILKCNKPADFLPRIAKAEKGMFDEDEDDDERREGNAA